MRDQRRDASQRRLLVDQPLAARPGIDRPKAQIDGHGTNIFQGIQLALAMLPPGQANRIVMLTDGRQNAGNALAGAQAAKDAAADIYYVAAPLTFTQEVVAEALVLPSEVKRAGPRVQQEQGPVRARQQRIVLYSALRGGSERRFHIRLSHQELEKLVTVADVLDLLQAKLNAPPQQPAAAA